MKRTISNLLLLVILGVGFYVYRAPIISNFDLLYSQYFPCKRPITYSVGSFDARFGIPRESFLKAVNDAETRWEEAIGRELFTYAPEGRLTINLVFDYRQEATLKMQKLGLSVDDNQASYDALTARYKLLKREFQELRASYDALVAIVKERSFAFNEEVTEWNKRKGAPKDVYARLSEENVLIKREVERIRGLEGELRELQDTLNSLVTVINQVANNINVSAEEFNKIGRTQGEEFTEGLYTRDSAGERIDIFEFTDRAKLARVLTHEFGHALSLEHVEDPKAIMYRLNQGVNTTLTPADIFALKRQCGIK